MGKASVLLRDIWFQIFLVLALGGVAAAAWSEVQYAQAKRTVLRIQAQAAVMQAVVAALHGPGPTPPSGAMPPPPGLPSAPGAPAAPTAPTLTGPGTSAVLKARKRGTWVVDEADSGDRDAATVFEAVLNAEDGDVVLIRPGRYKGGLDLGRSITLRGQPSKGRPVVLESPGTTVVRVTDGWVRLESMKIEQGARISSDGYFLTALEVAGGTVVLQDAEVASASQAGIAMSGGTLSVQGSTVSAQGTGLITIGGELSVDRSLFRDCNQTALSVSSASLSARVTRSRFTGNRYGFGGMGNMQVEDTVFEKNGMALLIAGGTLTLKRVSAVRNSLAGLSAMGKSVTIAADSEFSDNGAHGIGLSKDATMSAIGCRARRNRTQGVWASEGAVFQSVNGDFRDNRLGAYLVESGARMEGSRNKPELK